MIYDFPQPTPMIMVLGTHFTRASDVIVPDFLTTTPSVPITPYRDCSAIGAADRRARRAHAAARPTASCATAACPTPSLPNATQHAVEDLPPETLVYLLGSRYCETDRLSDIAWKLFENTPAGLGARAGDLRFRPQPHRVRLSVCPRHQDGDGKPISEGHGVCRDYAHLAITFCRCMNIPARYCTGYLGDIGMPQPWASAISPAGSRPISAGTGTLSTRATTCPASAAC